MRYSTPQGGCFEISAIAALDGTTSGLYLTSDEMTPTHG
jgi:hypothetical protein